jgi:putative tryptophan/tyrosine transport system substrate-binding protein
MTRIVWIAILIVTALAAPLGAEAQPAGKVPRIGVLSAGAAPSLDFADILRRGLAELGWIEGQNILIDYRYAEGRPDRYPALIAELLSLKVDVLVVGGGTPGARAAKQATTTIPIVLPIVGDPVASGLVLSLARPGGNVTGLSMLNTEISAKRVQLLREVLPTVKRVAVLSDPVVTALDLDATQAAARSFGLRLQVLSVGSEDFHGAFEAARKAGAEALIVLASSVFNHHRQRLVDLAAQNRLLAVYEHRQFPDAGGLMSYGPDLGDMTRRAAKYVDKILKGAKPADLPVEQPTKFQLVINRASRES